MDRLLLVPELNYWMRIVLHNSPLNEQFFKMPVPISEELGRCPGSVIDLLFNECFVTVPELSSSSQGLSSSTDNDIGNREIPGYYFFNDIPEIEELQSVPCIPESSSSSSTPSLPEPSSSSSGYSSSSCHCENFGKFEYIYKGIDKTKITDKNILQRITVAITKIDIMVCYTWHNESLFSEDASCGVFLPVNLFSITDEELCLLCKLYDYKTNQTVSLLGIRFEDLESCLAKTIYAYLDWEINESLTYFKPIQCFADTSDLLRALYEKHVIDHIYRTITTKFNITHNVNNIDLFVELNHNFKRVSLDENNITTKSFELPSEQKPYHERSSVLLHKGVQQEYSRDYEIKTNSTGNIYVQWSHNKFEIGDEIYFLWSFLDV